MRYPRLTLCGTTLLLTGLAALAGGCTSMSSDTSASEVPPATAVPTTGQLTTLTTATSSTEVPSTLPATSSTTAPANLTVRVGAEVLADSGFAQLQGQRVGAIVNQTSTADGTRLIDLLDADPGVELVSLFAPEHGIDGSLAAGQTLDDSVDQATGVPIFSLYGSTRQPTEAMFADLDVVVFDLQDVGSRSYTYISTMGLAMQTAAATGTRFLVLDRPNPLGGATTAGPILEPAHESFIGMYPLPSVHGLTVGEIAGLITSQGWLQGLDSLNLDVITMDGWSREATWSDLDREWVAPSPRLPSFDIALLYSGTVLLAGTSLSDGSGTPTPFALAGTPQIESADLFADRMNASGLPGVRFEATSFTPQSIPGVSPSPPYEGVEVSGVRLLITDHAAIDPVAIAINLLVTANELVGPDTSIITDPASFNLVAGSNDLRTWIEQGDSADDILSRFESGLVAFDELRAEALLYP